MKRGVWFAAIQVVSVVLLTIPLFGWGNIGHIAVAYVAYRVKASRRKGAERQQERQLSSAGLFQNGPLLAFAALDSNVAGFSVLRVLSD